MQKQGNPQGEDEGPFWADRVANELEKRKLPEYVCQGMWSPSGYMHIGNARPEIFVPNAVCEVLNERGLKARQNFILDDFDGIRKIPPDLGVKQGSEQQFLGKPYALAPSPLKGHKTWADAFVSEVKETINEFGLKANILSAYETYKSGKFNSIIKQSLDNSEKIISIWNSIAGADKPKDFLPLQVICEKCGRILGTEASGWNGSTVAYKCACGASGRISPFNGNAKLHWRVHWVAHWVLHNVSFETAGKDHFSKGGSVDVAQALIREVFNRQGPYQLPTEFIQLQGAKMSGSTGRLVKFSEWTNFAAPELFRFMNFVYRPNKAVDFSPYDNSFVLLVERFDQAERIYHGKEKPLTEKLGEKLKRAYALSFGGKPQKKMPLQVPYQLAVLVAQLADPDEQPGRALQMLQDAVHLPEKISPDEKNSILQRLKTAKRWAISYAPETFRIHYIENVPAGATANLTDAMRSALSELSEKIPALKTADEIQRACFECAASNSLKPNEFFKLLYSITTGSLRGPKFGTLAIALGRQKVASRLASIAKAAKPELSAKKEKNGKEAASIAKAAKPEG